MKKYLSVIPLVLLVCFLVGCQQPVKEAAEEPAVDIEAEREAILAVEATFLEGSKTKDINLVMSVFADDAVLSSSGEMYFKGREGIKKMFETNWVEWNSTWEVEKVEVSQSGDLAYTLVKRVATRESEGQIEQRIYGNHKLYKKQPDGSWKLIAF